MSEFYSTRAHQDGAVERFLRELGTSAGRYSMGFWERICCSDHEACAAVEAGYVDVWATERWLYLRVNDDGRVWLKGRQIVSDQNSLIHKLLHITKF